MGYNHNHHHHGKMHSHKDGKKHQHLHYDQPGAKLNKTNTKDDCCSNDVTQFTLLDKSVVHNNPHFQVPVFLLAFTTTSVTQTINEDGLAVNSKFQFVRRSSFLNDTDIQTAIRRFQI
jgi:hypothetical protein